TKSSFNSALKILFVPFGIRTLYFVACRKRCVGSYCSVFVSTHRNLPSTFGSISIGTNLSVELISETATIGKLNVTLKLGAKFTAPILCECSFLLYQTFWQISQYTQLWLC